MAPSTVFFSWQADTDTKVGRNLVERSLEQAVAAIEADADVEEAVLEITVDKDTKGVPGSPPIVETILRKIDGAAVFVPDLTDGMGMCASIHDEPHETHWVAFAFETGGVWAVDSFALDAAGEARQGVILLDENE